MRNDTKMNNMVLTVSEKWTPGKVTAVEGEHTERNINRINISVNGCLDRGSKDHTKLMNGEIEGKKIGEEVLYQLSSIFEVSTPTYTILTNGLVPHYINMKWLRKITGHFILNCPLDEVYKSIDVFKKTQRYYCIERKKNDSYLNRFCDFHCGLRYLSVRNMTADTCSVHVNKSITLKSNNSTVILSFEEFLKCVEIFEPDLFCIPSEDIRVGEEVGKKKKWRLGTQLEECLKKLRCLKENSSSSIHMYNALKCALCIVSVPSAVENISEAISSVLKKHDDIIDGYLISGLGCDETVEERTKCLHNIMTILSKEKYKIIQLNVGNPIEVLHSVYNGIDLVEAKFPFMLAQNGKAVVLNPTFDFNYSPSTIYDINTIDFKKSERFILDLTDPQFTFDYAPISENSPRTESRSYIHHLLKCKEMTAIVLLTYHNLYIYSLFFKEMQKQMKCNNFEHYVSWFIEQNGLL